jgi:hypothetical protein
LDEAHRPLAGAKARAHEKDLTQRSCEAKLGTVEEQLTPGWDEHLGRIGGLTFTFQMQLTQSRLIGLF